jgi:uncharacterized protein DUF4386
MHSTAKIARIAGALYLSTLPLAIYFWSYLPSKLIVRGNPAASGENILAHETLFRFSILGDLFTHVILLCLAFLLYRLLCHVDRIWAFVMVGFVLVSTAVAFFGALNNIAGLLLFRGGDFLSTVPQAQREALAMLFIRVHGQGYLVNEVFSGLWLFPLGRLVFGDGFLQRFVAVWLQVACFGWLALSVVALVFPRYYDIAFRFAQPVVLGEMAFALWLLIKGPDFVGPSI